MVNNAFAIMGHVTEQSAMITQLILALAAFCQYDIGRLAWASAQCKVEMKYMYEVRLLTKIDVIKFKKDMFLYLATWLST